MPTVVKRCVRSEAVALAPKPIKPQASIGPSDRLPTGPVTAAGPSVADITDCGSCSGERWRSLRRAPKSLAGCRTAIVSHSQRMNRIRPSTVRRSPSQNHVTDAAGFSHRRASFREDGRQRISVRDARAETTTAIPSHGKDASATRRGTETEVGLGRPADPVMAAVRSAAPASPVRPASAWHPVALGAIHQIAAQVNRSQGHQPDRQTRRDKWARPDDESEFAREFSGRTRVTCSRSNCEWHTSREERARRARPAIGSAGQRNAGTP